MSFLEICYKLLATCVSDLSIDRYVRAKNISRPPIGQPLLYSSLPQCSNFSTHSQIATSVNFCVVCPSSFFFLGFFLKGEFRYPNFLKKKTKGRDFVFSQKLCRFPLKYLSVFVLSIKSTKRRLMHCDKNRKMFVMWSQGSEIYLCVIVNPVIFLLLVLGCSWPSRTLQQFLNPDLLLVQLLFN